MQALAIGLTGSIASGKSFVLNIFKQRDFSTLDTDDVVHDLISNDKNIKREIKEIFPDSYNDNQIDRKKLAKIVFSNNLEKLNILEKILHPAVINKCQNFIRENKNKNKKSIIEVPLLFESGMDNLFDKIITISMDENLQKDIAIKQRNISEEIYRNIISRQLPISEKEKRADIIIHNKLDKEDIYKQVSYVINNL